VARSVEERLAVRVECVGARRAAALDVADVHHEGERLGIELAEHEDESPLLGLEVRRVAEHGETETCLCLDRQRDQRHDERERAGERLHSFLSR
jgi:hypothetical protein